MLHHFAFRYFIYSSPKLTLYITAWSNCNHNNYTETQEATSYQSSLYIASRSLHLLFLNTVTLLSFYIMVTNKSKQTFG